jgi:hypothetical protein
MVARIKEFGRVLILDQTPANWKIRRFGFVGNGWGSKSPNNVRPRRKPSWLLLDILLSKVWH